MSGCGEICCGCDVCRAAARTTILCSSSCDTRGCNTSYCALGSGLMDHLVAPPPRSVSWDIRIGDVDPAFAKALGICDPLDIEREELANDRAARQTLAWRYGRDEHGQPLPKPHDPTSILDEVDPWA